MYHECGWCIYLPPMFIFPRKRMVAALLHGAAAISRLCEPKWLDRCRPVVGWSISPTLSTAAPSTGVTEEHSQGDELPPTAMSVIAYNYEIINIICITHSLYWFICFIITRAHTHARTTAHTHTRTHASTHAPLVLS